MFKKLSDAKGISHLGILIRLMVFLNTFLMFFLHSSLGVFARVFFKESIVLPNVTIFSLWAKWPERGCFFAELS